MTQPAKKRTRARCGNHAYPAASFPEGHLCWRCLTAALAVAGTCPGCGTGGRLLPGLRDGVRICRDCAGITREFCCLRCGTETGMTGRRRGPSRLCGPCSVTWTAARLLDDGTGAIAAPLKPLARALAAAPSPAAILEWLDRRPQTLAGHPHLRLLRQFGLWHQLPAMRARTAAGPLRTTAAQYARSRFIQAQTFLTWTAALGVRPSALTQAHIDAYYGTHQREGVRAFLTWAAGHGHIPRHLDIPRQQPHAGQVITQQRRPGPAAPLRHRHGHLHPAPRRRLPDASLRPAAQPHPAAVRRRPDPRRRRPDLAAARRPAQPRPRPFGALLHHLAATRHDHVPANHGSDWLFPGRHAGQPAEYRSIAAQLRDHGLLLRTARISALGQLVLQVPAPVVAGALGFHHTTTTRQHINAGATWSRYVAGGRPDRDPREGHGD